MEEYIEPIIISDDWSRAYCAGPRNIILHAVEFVPLALAFAGTGRVRSGVCEVCGTRFVSLLSQKITTRGARHEL